MNIGAIAQKVERNDACSYPESSKLPWTKGAPRGVVEVAGSIPAGSD
jgi:hypothetical protein